MEMVADSTAFSSLNAINLGTDICTFEAQDKIWQWTQRPAQERAKESMGIVKMPASAMLVQPAVTSSSRDMTARASWGSVPSFAKVMYIASRSDNRAIRVKKKTTKLQMENMAKEASAVDFTKASDRVRLSLLWGRGAWPRFLSGAFTESKTPIISEAKT